MQERAGQQRIRRIKAQAKRLACTLAVLGTFGFAAPAHAELWGYIDG